MPRNLTDSSYLAVRSLHTEKQHHCLVSATQKKALGFCHSLEDLEGVNKIH